MLIGLVPLDQLRVIQEPLAHGLDMTGHPIAAVVLSCVAVLGIIAIILVGSIGQTRILYVMSRDGLMPRFMGKVHEKSGSPIASSLLPT